MMLAGLNSLPKEEIRKQLYNCCASTKWSDELAACFPFDNVFDLKKKAKEIWSRCTHDDWKEAFSHHPEIGDISALKKKFAGIGWAEGEQKSVKNASDEILHNLKRKNELYKNKFGYIFIICATGKSAKEMLEALEDRIKNGAESEIRIAASEQQKIMQLRIDKLLS